jgi:hypothetical protein
METLGLFRNGGAVYCFFAQLSMKKQRLRNKRSEYRVVAN